MKKKILLSVLLLNMFQIVEAASYVSCGGSGDIPSAIPAFIRGIILIIKYLVPLGLILFGGYDLLKVVYSNDKKDMDDVVRKLIEKTIAGVAVFFVVAGVQLLVKQTSSSSNISNCVSCFAVSENYCNVYDKEEEDHSDEKRTNDEARKERDEKREQGRKENEKTSDAAKKEAEKEIDPESVRNGSSSPGSSLSSGDASGILEGAKKVHSVYESQKWFYYTDLGQLRWNDVQYSTNNPSKATCCATFVGSAFLVGGVFTEQELNQVNYNSVFGISEICEKHGWSKVTNYSQLQPGDIVIMTSPGSGSSPGHVQIYAGNGTWYNAGSTWAIQSPNPYSSDASGRFLWAWRIPGGSKNNNNNNNNNSSNPGTQNLEGGTYAEQAFKYLSSNGWTKEAAAGAVGNMYQETNYGGKDINPWAADRYGNGGIVGWTDNGEANNMTLFKNYASSKNDPWPKTSLKTQLDFLMIHMKDHWWGAYATPTYNGLNSHGYSVSKTSYDEFKKGTSVRNACLQFLAFYEDCGYDDSNVDYRCQMAESVYNSYK